jgi:glycosyltransferase involved in cell wall biosynthesis
MPNDRHWVWAVRWYDFCQKVQSRLTRQMARQRSAWRLHYVDRVLDLLAEPGRRWDMYRGVHDQRYPGTWLLPTLPPKRPQLIHCHNLHNEYFDLRALPWLSRQMPVILSLHDAWLLTGVCCHSFDCERWKTGCGHCPYLNLWQDVKRSRDGTAINWERKRQVYAQSRLRVTTACRWLMDKVEQSMLAPGVIEKRVIPYGIDLTRYHPAEDRGRVRAELDIPPDALALLFVARGLEKNQSKDYSTLRAAIEQLAARQLGRRIVFLARGHTAPTERLGNVEIRYIPWEEKTVDVARFYQAADIYVHTARVDTFPLAVLEALACGTPVVATAVGGIPEQLKSLGPIRPESATGILVPLGDVTAIRTALERLLTDDPLCQRLGRNAAQDARARFSLELQVQTYLAWYEEALYAHCHRNGRASAG